MKSQRTANIVLTGCLSRAVHLIPNLLFSKVPQERCLFASGISNFGTT
jgi:hypothetical protein